MINSQFINWIVVSSIPNPKLENYYQGEGKHNFFITWKNIIFRKKQKNERFGQYNKPSSVMNIIWNKMRKKGIAKYVIVWLGGF